MTQNVTYFWSGSNHAGEIAALADSGKDLGVTVTELDKEGGAMAQLERLGDYHVTLGVTRNSSGKPIVMFNRGRGTCAKLPEGDTLVKVAGKRYMVGFRKVACNVARALNSARNVMGELLETMFGPEVGKRGAGHHVVLKLTRAGWEMTPEELAELEANGSSAFVDSGAYSEVKFTAEGPVVVEPITHESWLERLEKMTDIGRALRGRAFLVAPDMVGNQEETLKRLERYRETVCHWRDLGANVIVVLQKGKLSQLEFDAKCSEVLGFNDYVRGVPSKKAAATVEEIGELVAGLPEGTRVHLLGLSPFGKRWDEVLEAIPEGRPLLCDSVRIRALVGRKNGPGGGPRVLTKLRDEVAAEFGFEGRKLGPVESFLVKYRALCRYFEEVEATS